MSDCMIEGCAKEAKNSGLCWAHYERKRKYGDASIMKRATPAKDVPERCTVEGCDKRHLAKGLCSAHYSKAYRYGSATEPHRRAESGAHLAWMAEALKFEGDDCLPWPFKAKNPQGYGILTVEGRAECASRAMCAMAHGEPPTPLHEAAHSCGRGHEGCMNARHLRWATRSENHLDKRQHGTSRANARLTADQVRAIRKHEGRALEAAARFGISVQHFYAIKSGDRWGELE